MRLKRGKKKVNRGKIEVKQRQIEVKMGCGKLLSGPNLNHSLETVLYRPSGSQVPDKKNLTCCKTLVVCACPIACVAKTCAVHLVFALGIGELCAADQRNQTHKR